jgi:hypothetical protein
MRLDALTTEEEDRACIAWTRPSREDRTFVEISGKSVTVVLKTGVVRVVVQLDGVSRVVTDFVERVEIRAWTRSRAPPLPGKRDPAPKNSRGRTGHGAG